GGFLQHGIGPVLKLLARAVPVHHEASYVQVLGADDLLPEHGRVVAGVADRDVFTVSEPGLVHGQQHGASRPGHAGAPVWRMPRAAGQLQQKQRSRSPRKKWHGVLACPLAWMRKAAACVGTTKKPSCPAGRRVEVKDEYWSALTGPRPAMPTRWCWNLHPGC